MPANSRPIPAFDPTVLAQLACPACLGALCLEEAGLVCKDCNHVYRIVDGIPKLIAGQAGLPQ